MDSSRSMSGVDPFVITAFGPPPTGINLNDETETRNNVITGVFLALAALSVLARWVARKIRDAHLGVDDYAIFVSLFLCIVTGIVNIYFGRTGSGRHVWALTRALLGRGLKIGFAYTFLWAVSVSITKLSIILLYRRIFAVNKSAFRNWLDFLACVIVGQIIAITITNLAGCRPLSYTWDKLSPDAHGTCFDGTTFLLAVGIINAVFDIIILVTPLAPISKLELSALKKAGIFGLFLLGCFVCIASWIRVYYLVLFVSAIDTTWVSGETATWSSIEASLGIVSACLPVMRPLYLKIQDLCGLLNEKSKEDHRGSIPQPIHPHNLTHHLDRRGHPTREHFSPYQSDDAINLTNFVSGGLSEENIDVDRIMVRSEVKQTHSYV